jgi:hypothetical protein
MFLALKYINMEIYIYVQKKHYERVFNSLQD